MQIRTLQMPRFGGGPQAIVAAVYGLWEGAAGGRGTLDKRPAFIMLPLGLAILLLLYLSP